MSIERDNLLRNSSSSSTNLTSIAFLIRETEEFVKRALSVGVDFITVHGRTRRQKSTEPVNLEGMKLVKEVSTVPVLANGDVFSVKDADDIVGATGVDGKRYLNHTVKGAICTRRSFLTRKFVPLL